MAVVKGSAQFTATFSQEILTGVISPQKLGVALNKQVQYSNGTGANQVDLCYAKQLVLAGAATTLDLTNLNDLSGASVSFARVRELMIEVVTSDVDKDVTVGNAAANAWAPFWGATGTEKVFAGTFRHVSDPGTIGSGKGAVVSGTSKSLKLDPGANTVTVNVFIVGCSAAS